MIEELTFEGFHFLRSSLLTIGFTLRLQLRRMQDLLLAGIPDLERLE